MNTCINYWIWKRQLLASSEKQDSDGLNMLSEKNNISSLPDILR